tara:strand:- start:527 stop:2668 length:2142 start_codon:yes stop_codon:yes gene_type:complete
MRGFELGLETDRMFADAERKREEREAGITDIQRQAQGVEPITIKDVRDFALATAPITGDVIAFKDAPEDYTRAYELLQAGYGERDLIKMGLGGAFTGLITMGLIPGLGFVSRMGKNMLRQMAIDAFKRGDRKTGTDILVNTSDYVKKELGDKFNKNISTKRQSQIKEIKNNFKKKEHKKRIKMLDKPRKEILYHGTSMGQFTESPKLGTYIDKDFQANQLATTFRDNSKIFTEMVDANNGNPIIDIDTYGMKVGKDVDEIDKYAGAKIQFPILAMASKDSNITPTPKVYNDTISLETNAEAGEVYLKGTPSAINNYEGETYGVVKLLDNNKVDLRDIEAELTKRNRQDLKEVVELDKTFIDNIARRGFDTYEDSTGKLTDKTYLGLATRKTPIHAELGTPALSMSLDPITSVKPAFTSPGGSEVGDMAMGTDEMGRTVENLLFTELPYGKFKSMTPDDYNKIVNLYSRDKDLREGLFNKYRDVMTDDTIGIKLPKSAHTEAEVAFTRPDFLRPKKVVDDPKVLANVEKANEAFDKYKKLELSIGSVDNRALIGDPVNQKKGYDLVKNYFNSALELAKFTRTEGARGGYDEIIDELDLAPNLTRLIGSLSIVLPKGEKKNNMRVLETLLDRPTRGRMMTAPKRLKGYQDREAPKDFSAKKFVNELQSTLRETKGNILDYKLATEEKILSLSPRQYKEVIMEITPKLNRGGLMTR